VARQSRDGKFSPYLRIRLAWERFGIPEGHPLGRAVVMDVQGRNKALPWGYIIPAAEDQTPQAYLGEERKIGGRLVEGIADVELVMTWTDYCVEKHHKCKDRKRITGFQVRLVDVKDRILKEFDDEGDEMQEYVAVSYVHDETTGGTLTLGADVPRIFEDAMSFTEQLGYRYIYIHPYCQTEDLASVFSSADLTLVFTTPNSPVSIPRTPQLSLQCDARLYLTSLLRPDLEISSSPWGRQGSTFQEGLLSTRRVVFTSSQVYWQCAEMSLCESICVPLQYTEGLNLGRVFPEEGAYLKAAEYKRTVRDYLAKDFADPQEKLQSFKGVAEQYKRESGIGDLLGLPLFSRESSAGGEEGMPNARLAFGLSWAPVRPQTGTQAEGYVLESPRQCPSWTWLAWRPTTGGGFTFPSSEDSNVHYSAPPKMEISLGLQDGAVIPWGLVTGVDTPGLKLDFLRIKTYAFSLNVKKEEETSAITGAHLARAQRDLIKSWVRKQGEWELMGLVLLAKSWRDAGDKEAVCLLLGPEDLTSSQEDAVNGETVSGEGTALAAARGGEAEAEPNGTPATRPWTRLGVLSLNFLDFTPLDDETAVLEGMALDGGDKGDLGISVKEVDVY
jgi:hypothetical protein